MLQQSTVDALSNPRRVASGEEARRALREFFAELTESEAGTLFVRFWEQVYKPSSTPSKG